MEDIRYYSLVDIDIQGRIKVALIPTGDEQRLKENGEAYLEEVVPHSFWLHSERKLAEGSTILCPRCGEKMLQVAEADEHIKNSIYVCQRCKKGAR